jgi:hypothetical protein
MHPQVASNEVLQSAPDCFAIVKSDSDNFAYQVRAIYVGGAGNVVVITPSGAVVTFSGVPAGSVLPVRAVRVNSTDTTATNMVGLY